MPMYVDILKKECFCVPPLSHFVMHIWRPWHFCSWKTSSGSSCGILGGAFGVHVKLAMFGTEGLVTREAIKPIGARATQFAKDCARQTRKLQLSWVQGKEPFDQNQHREDFLLKPERKLCREGLSKRICKLKWGPSRSVEHSGCFGVYWIDWADTALGRGAS